MSRVAAIWTRHHVAARARRSSGPPVAKRATVRQAGADPNVVVDVAHAVFLVRSLPLQTSELALKQLPSAPDRAEWITIDDVYRRARRHDIAAPRSDFIQ